MREGAAPIGPWDGVPPPSDVSYRLVVGGPVLIVDDNEADRVLTRLMLERSQRWGPVGTVSSGEDALAMFADFEATQAANPEHFPPRLLLLDINMPRMNGFEFLEALGGLELPEDRAPAIVVMLSSEHATGDRRRAERFAAVRGFVHKPLTVDHAIELADVHSAGGVAQ